MDNIILKLGCITVSHDYITVSKRNQGGCESCVWAQEDLLYMPPSGPNLDVTTIHKSNKGKKRNKSLIPPGLLILVHFNDLNYRL